MSAKKLVETTLVMPEDMPLFNYNLSFQNLRSLVQNLNLQISSNTQQINALKQQIATKLPKQKLQQQQQLLNDCLRLGINSQKISEANQGYGDKNGQKQHKQMNNMEKFGWKMGKLTQVLQHVVNLTQDLKSKVNNNENQYKKNIDDINKRVQQKINTNFDSMTKNINLYFTQTNKKVAALQTEINSLKINTNTTFQTINNNLNQKISKIQLDGAIKGINQQVKTSILVDLQNDQMKRLATLNQLNTKLQTYINESQLKIKSIKQTVKQISDRVTKSLSVQTFQIQKHKIYEKLSEYKSKIDDMGRKNQQFIDFRKNFYEAMQKVKQNMMEIQDNIKKLKETAAKNAPSQDAQILASLDPHLICQINNQVKLHQKQIGKLQKQVIYLQNQLQSVRSSTKKVPQGSNSQTADTIIKIVKQYMVNLDFQGRVKRLQRQLHDVSKKGDMISDLDKKIYMLSKDIDVGAIMKQMKRKADEDNTRKDFKILDSKIQKLFDFYRQIRKQTEQFFMKSSKAPKQPNDNAAMTTKRLYSVNCISCTPRRIHTNRNYSRNKLQISMDESGDDLKQLKNSMYVKGTTH